jgi:hypothetical protein
MRPLVVALAFAVICLGVPGSSSAQGLPDESPCTFNRDCLSHKCRGGAHKHCQGPPLLPAGAPCLHNAQCHSGKCRGGHNKACQGD